MLDFRMVSNKDGNNMKQQPLSLLIFVISHSDLKSMHITAVYSYLLSPFNGLKNAAGQVYYVNLLDGKSTWERRHAEPMKKPGSIVHQFIPSHPLVK